MTPANYPLVVELRGRTQAEPTHYLRGWLAGDLGRVRMDWIVADGRDLLLLRDKADADETMTAILGSARQRAWFRYYHDPRAVSLAEVGGG